MYPTKSIPLVGTGLSRPFMLEAHPAILPPLKVHGVTLLGNCGGGHFSGEIPRQGTCCAEHPKERLALMNSITGSIIPQ